MVRTTSNFSPRRMEQRFLEQIIPKFTKNVPQTIRQQYKEQNNNNKANLSRKLVSIELMLVILFAATVTGTSIHSTALHLADMKQKGTFLSAVSSTDLPDNYHINMDRIPDPHLVRKSLKQWKPKYIRSKYCKLIKEFITEMKDEKYIFLQDLLERYFDLTDRQTAVINQLRSSLTQTFPEMEKTFRKIDCNASLAILSQYQTPCDLLKTSDQTIQKLVRSHNGRINGEKLAQLKDLCGSSVAWKHTKYHKLILQSQVEELLGIKKLIKKMRTSLDEFVMDPQFELQEDFELLQSVPGVAELTSCLALAVIGNAERFDPDNDGKGAKRVSSFVGYGIREYSSGMKMIKKGITKRSNSRFQGLLFMAAMNAVRHDSDFQSQHQRVKENGGNGKKSLSNIAHTLARRCYGVLRSKKPYDVTIPLSQGAGN